METKIDCGCEKDVFACRTHAHPTTHTPTPWINSDMKIRSFQTKQLIADVYFLRADAAFIVQAVNSHDELVKELTRCRNLLLDSVNFHSGDMDTIEAVSSADDALAKAEAKP